MQFQILISFTIKNLLLKIFRKINISSMQKKLCNYVYEHYRNINIYEQDTLIHFKPMLHFKTFWEH